MRYEVIQTKVIRASWVAMVILLFMAAVLGAQATAEPQMPGHRAAARPGPGMQMGMMMRGGFGGGMMGGAMRRGPMGIPLPPLSMLARQLHLTPAQLRQLRDLEFNTRKTLIRERANLAIAQLTLHHLLQAEPPDQAAILAQVNTVGNLRTQMMTRGVKALLAGEAVLTPSQRQQARRLIARHLRMMAMMRRMHGRFFFRQFRGAGGNMFWMGRRGGPGAGRFRKNWRGPLKPKPSPPAPPDAGANN